MAANLSRRTGHRYENLHQIVVMGIIETSRRYARVRGPFRPYIRTYVNCEGSISIEIGESSRYASDQRRAERLGDNG